MHRQKSILNKRKAHILLSRLLLLFFVAGQIVVYAHQHHAKYNTIIVDAYGKTDQHASFQEKCNVCDQMHNAPLSLVQTPLYRIVLISVVYLYYSPQHHYQANALVHADGLSPPDLV